MSVKIVEVDVDNEGRRLDNYLISYLKDIPKSKIYKIIRKGEIRVNSSRAKPDRKIKNGDLIRIPPNLNITKTSIKSIHIKQLENLKEKIIYEDKNYIVINKDAGIAVHGGSKNYIGIIDIARKIYGRNIDLCHRLDKNTSGCLVLAKNKQSAKHFNNLIKNRLVQKTYVCVLKGNIRKSIVVNRPVYKTKNSKSKEAHSKFEKIKNLKGFSVVKVKIFTGRTHQIRIHAAMIGHPIVFDNKYGDRILNNNLDYKLKRRIALHSHHVRFKDLDSKIIDIKCKNQPDIDILIKSLH